jgi:hypothetical protein
MHDLIQQAIETGLNVLNCPDITAERMAYVRPHVFEVEELLPDPRGANYPPLPRQAVRVRDKNGNVRLVTGNGPTRPLEIAELIRELCGGEDRLHGVSGRHIGQELRWRLYGSPL